MIISRLILVPGLSSMMISLPIPTTQQILQVGDFLMLLTLFASIRFGHLDDRATESTPPSKLPSFINMCEFAIQDDEVKAQFTKERMEQATDDFTEG